MSINKQYAYIRAIERFKSISAAANFLGMSQPALSASLKKAETRLGAPIFDRSTTPLRLTEAGRAYLDYERKAEVIERELERTISDLTDMRRGELVIGGAASFNAAYLPNALARFTAQYPGINVRVIDDTAPRIAQAALDGSVDVFITPDLEDASQFDCRELLSERIFLCLPLPWKENSLLKISQGTEAAPIGEEGFALLDQRPFIVLGEDQQLGKKLRELFRRYEFEPASTIQVNQTLTSLAFTQQGIGASLATEGTLRQMASAGAPIATYLPDQDICTRTLYIAAPKNRQASRAAKAFSMMLQEANRSADN